MQKPLLTLSPAQLQDFVKSTTERRQQTLGRTPPRKTIAAVAAAWNVPKETLAKALVDLVESKHGKNSSQS